MRVLIPLLIVTAILFADQVRRGRPSWLARALALYLLAALILKAPWPLL